MGGTAARHPGPRRQPARTRHRVTQSSACGSPGQRGGRGPSLLRGGASNSASDRTAFVLWGVPAWPTGAPLRAVLVPCSPLQQDRLSVAGGHRGPVLSLPVPAPSRSRTGLCHPRRQVGTSHPHLFSEQASLDVVNESSISAVTPYNPEFSSGEAFGHGCSLSKRHRAVQVSAAASVRVGSLCSARLSFTPPESPTSPAKSFRNVPYPSVPAGSA